MSRAEALVTLGSPVFFGPQRTACALVRLGLWLTLGGRLRVDLLSSLLVPMAGWLPWPSRVEFANLRQLRGPVQRWLLACTMAPLWRGVLRQLRGWLLRDAFDARDGSVDFRARVRALEIPCLVVGGSIDRLAPPEVVRQHFELLSALDRDCWVLGREHGQVDEYGHGDLILGKRTPQELHPRLVAWLCARASAVNAPITSPLAPPR